MNKRLHYLAMISRHAIQVFILQVIGMQFLFAVTHGQDLDQVKVSLDVRDALVTEVLQTLERKTGFEFAYSEKVENMAQRFTLAYKKASLKKILEDIARTGNLNFRRVNGTITVQLSTTSGTGPLPPTVPDKIIRGKVTGPDDTPLPGANIIVKGTTIGTNTDVDGNYVLSVPDDATVLLFSYIGYVTEEMAIAGRSVIDVTLVPDIQSLKNIEVVSTGYYEVEQRLNPGNIVKVDSKVIGQQPISNPLQALQGRLTGVSITQRSGVPGSNFDIQIRGTNSLRDDGNDPLYLINGVPYPSQSLSFIGGQLNAGGISPLNFINPNDIESIEILKDADATAIYGSRGANGVVRITTKMGRSGKLRVTYNGSIGSGTLENRFDVLNTEQYLIMRNEAFRNDGVEPGNTDFDVNGTWDQDRETDWQEELLGGSSNFTNHQLSFSGGNDNTNFLFGLNYQRESTIFSNDFFDSKISGNLNLNHISNDRRLELVLQSNFLVNNNDLFNVNYARLAVRLAPNAPALINEEDGSLNWENGTFNNPLAELNRESNTRTSNINNAVSIGYEVLPNLRVKVNSSYNEIQSDETFISPISAFNPFLDGQATGRATFGNSVVKTWIAEPQIEYTQSSNNHEITALIGASYQETLTDRQSILATGYDSDALIRNPLAAEVTEVNGVDNSQYRFNSVFGRINYIYNEKYIINLTGRRDGSSRFGPGEQFANFGAVGVGWIFSEESFISDNFPFLSFGKLRGSYGVTGSDAIGNYEYLELWEPTAFGYDGTQGLAPENLFNQDFAWEETTKAEIGVELGLLEDKINLNVSYFDNSSSNQLIGQPLPGITGFTSVRTNFPADVRNWGWEFYINTVNLARGDFKWSSSLNLSILRNELVAFDDIEKTGFANTYVVGEPLSVLFRLDYQGVDPETGLATFIDVDRSERISANDRLPLGNRQQDYFGGLNNTISYKGFIIDFLFRFVKQTGLDPISYYSGETAGQFLNQPTFVLDRWKNPGEVTNVPKFTQTGLAQAANRNISSSDLTFTDASFIRLQNVRFSYQFPTALIQKYSMGNLLLYVQGQNLLTFTGYRGWDPETQSLALPPLRMITAGLTVTF